jgi:hypothetical protein
MIPDSSFSDRRVSEVEYCKYSEISFLLLENSNDRFGSLAESLAQFTPAAALGLLADISWTGSPRSELNVRSHRKRTFNQAKTVEYERKLSTTSSRSGCSTQRLTETAPLARPSV